MRVMDDNVIDVTPENARPGGEAARERDEIRQELAALKATLPREYVLRDDYIRNQAVLEAKMDGIHKTLTDLYKIESVKKS